MLYEIINPSDPVTIEAPSFEVAALATIMLANGGYGAKPIEGDGEEVPIFLFSSWRAWVTERFGFEKAEDMLEQHKGDVITALRSACTGSAKDRQLYDTAVAAITDPEMRAAFVAEWDDKRRTSLTAITSNAHKLAEALAR